MDPFILYGGMYKKLRDSMSGAMNEKEIATEVLCTLLIYLCTVVELEATGGGTFPACNLCEGNSQSGQH
jgi:hypothetical protein